MNSRSPISIELVYVAYCKKQKTIPEASWIESFNNLDETVKSVILDSIKFILYTNEGEKRIEIYDIDTSSNSVIEIEHEKDRYRSIGIRDLFAEILKHSADQTKFLELGNVFAMKYLKADYSRSRAIIIAPFIFKGNEMLGIIATDIEDEKIPKLDPKQKKLKSELIKNAIIAERIVKGKTKEYRASKICIYPAYDRGQFLNHNRVKIYQKTSSKYFMMVFQILKEPPIDLQRDFVIKLISNLLLEFRDFNDTKRKIEELENNLEKNGVLNIDDIVEISGLNRDIVEEAFNEAYGVKHSRVITDVKAFKDIKCRIEIESIQITFNLRDLLDEKLKIIKIEDRIGLLIPDLGGDLSMINLKIIGLKRFLSLDSLIYEEEIPRVRIVK